MSNIYTENANTIIRIHTREEVKKLFETLSQSSSFDVSEVMCWSAVALVVFNDDQSKDYAVAVHGDYGYYVTDLNSGDVKSNIKIEIRNPSTLAYFKAISAYHLNSTYLDEDRQLLQLIMLALEENGFIDADGHIAPKYLGKGHQDFGSFKLKLDLESHTKEIMLYDFNANVFGAFKQEIVINDFFASAELLLDLIEKAKTKSKNRSSTRNPDFVDELKRSKMMFTPCVEEEKYSLNPELGGDVFHKARSTVLATNHQSSISLLLLVNVVIDAKNSGSDVKSAVKRLLLNRFSFPSEAELEVILEALYEYTQSPLVNDLIVKNKK
ncbi:hypothetical protein NI385_29380 (plasmid) [Vibrio parahaemolyticus]|nr:hypothetical protein NI385_29380 [Vibrio parahaemolyticus]